MNHGDEAITNRNDQFSLLTFIVHTSKDIVIKDPMILFTEQEMDLINLSSQESQPDFKNLILTVCSPLLSCIPVQSLSCALIVTH